MSNRAERIERDRQMLREAMQQGLWRRLGLYVRLAGPGWLQSAITLGGGSLAGSLYLGVLMGYQPLFVQVVAMALGVVMLGAIAYVTLATGERPFPAIRDRINPVLAWAWAIATLVANVVWAFPQFSLATAAVQQNLFPAMGETTAATALVCGAILLITVAITWFYDTGAWGIRLYEGLLRLLVAGIVLSFVGVVIRLTLAEQLPWSAIVAGFVPDLSLLRAPAEKLLAAVEATGAYKEFWWDRIVNMQRDVIITASATAVGINMTFLLPYSMLARGWDRNFRGLALFDLSTGMAVPFVLATSCVVIAAASQFHARPAPGLIGAEASQTPPPGVSARLFRDYRSLLQARLAAARSRGDESITSLAEIPEAEKRVAAMIVKRDAFDLAAALEPLTGRVIARYVFGFGVLAMALSTITILMLISGFAICEMLDLPAEGWPHRLGCLAPAIGALGPFVWGQAQFWLAVPASVIGMMLLPIAYGTFVLMMNSRRLLGDARPAGWRRVTWNVLMIAALLFATFGAGWSIWSRIGIWSVPVVGGFLVLVIIGHRWKRGDESGDGEA